MLYHTIPSTGYSGGKLVIKTSIAVIHGTFPIIKSLAGGGKFGIQCAVYATFEVPSEVIKFTTIGTAFGQPPHNLGVVKHK